tara:strand:+ start:100 stop:441 length:342 start_codon:yes stop_codon:yes gene_type:complete
MLSILDFSSLLFSNDRFLPCSIINGINELINRAISIISSNKDPIDEKRLLNLSFDFRNDENGLNINVRIIDIIIYITTDLTLIKNIANRVINASEKTDFKIDFVNSSNFMKQI